MSLIFTVVKVLLDDTFMDSFLYAIWMTYLHECVFTSNSRVMIFFFFFLGSEFLGISSS